MINDYLCPICKEGYITIEKERVGEPGFRDSEFRITNMISHYLRAALWKPAHIWLRRI